jgi:hypothetical protein
MIFIFNGFAWDTGSQTCVLHLSNVFHQAGCGSRLSSSPPALLRKHLRLLLSDAKKLGPRARLANALCCEVRMCLRLEAERRWRWDPRGEAERRRDVARQLAEPEVRVLAPLQ